MYKHTKTYTPLAFTFTKTKKPEDKEDNREERNSYHEQLEQKQRLKLLHVKLAPGHQYYFTCGVHLATRILKKSLKKNQKKIQRKTSRRENAVW
jgi:hypothetical protein